MLSVIIPTLNEVNTLPGLLHDLADTPCQIIVVDGGSRDGTTDVAAAAGAQVVRAPRGRGTQMNGGARYVRGDWLLFLHADVRLPPAARRDLRDTVTDVAPFDAAVWRLRIESRHPIFRLIEFGARMRDRVLGLPYGDQGLLVRRSLFESIGGFRDIPVMEDVVMIRAVKRRTAIHRFRSPVVVSSRRWDRHGPIRMSLRNVMMIVAFFVGVPPHRLTGFYRPESG